MTPITNFFNKTIKSKGSLGNMGNVLHNRFVLYLFVFMTIIDLMYFASSGDIRSLLTLLIIGFLTSFFSKNMIVILFTTLVITHILKYGTNVSEGMENEDETVVDNSGNSVSTKKEKKNVEDESFTSEPMTKTKPVSTKELKDELSDFQSIQDKILSGMKEIDPLLTKAEAFIEKFEHYKASKRLGGKADDSDE